MYKEVWESCSMMWCTTFPCNLELIDILLDLIKLEFDIRTFECDFMRIIELWQALLDFVCDTYFHIFSIL